MISIALSKRYTLEDLTKSSTALRFGINNHPTSLVEIDNLTALCTNVLERVWDKFGKPRIESGFRSPELNKKIGGAKNSQHMSGEAADIEVDGLSNLDIFSWMMTNISFDQLILEFHNATVPSSGWVHVSHSRSRNRSEVLEAVRNSAGKTEYRPWKG